MKKAVIFFSTVGAAVLLSSTFVLGASYNKKITAELREGTKIYVNNTQLNLKDSKGKTIYPIYYNGSTYLPVRSLAESVLNSKVSWDSDTQSVHITTETNNTTSVDTSIVSLQSSIEKLHKEVNELQSIDQQTFLNYKNQIDSLEDQLEQYENTVEAKLENASITYDEFTTLDTEIEKLETILDNMEDDLKGKIEITQPDTPSDSNGNASEDTSGEINEEINTLANKITVLVKEIKSLNVPASYSERKQQYLLYENKIEQLDNEIDSFETTIENMYRKQELSRDYYYKYKSRLSNLEHRIEGVENALEGKLGDFD